MIRHLLKLVWSRRGSNGLVAAEMLVSFLVLLGVLTLGLFYLVINGLMFALAASLLDGLRVAGCLPAILGGLVMALFNVLIRVLRGDSAAAD